ncbi:MAG: hypothetical protein KDN20_02110 [Verrucomicrobiae bacterium]|nr:hypothetical protein [Verrucomicrobiae bacterium]
MKKTFGDYRRLAHSALGFSSLWMGEDHLLYVKGSGFLLPYSEEYKRFRYRDIQALTMARTSGVWLGVVGYLVALFVVASIGFGFLFAREPGDVGFLVATLIGPLPLSVLLLALMIRHWMLGPKCLFQIQTELKQESITSVNRVHRARETFAQLEEKIRAAQMDLVPATLGISENVLGTPRSRISQHLQIPKLTLPAFASQAALGLSLLLLLHLSSVWLSGLFFMIALLGMVPLLIVLASSVRHPTPDGIRQALWAQLVTGLILAATASIYFLDQAINDPSLTVSITGPLEAFADITAFGGFAFYLIFLSMSLAHLGIAATGLFLTNRWRLRLGPDLAAESPTSPPLP